MAGWMDGWMDGWGVCARLPCMYVHTCYRSLLLLLVLNVAAWCVWVGCVCVWAVDGCMCYGRNEGAQCRYRIHTGQTI